MRIEDYLSENFGYDRDLKKNWNKLFEEWQSWYVGYNRGFHDYFIYNGKRPIQLRRKSLQMAKKCCEDWADMLFNVNCEITVKNSESQKQLQNLLTRNNFWLITNQAIEKAFSVGTGALIISVNGLKYNEDTNTIIIDEAEPQIEYCDVEKIYPISWDNITITECAFTAYKTIKGKHYAIISVHHLNEKGNYIISNKILSVSETGDLQEISEETNSQILGAFSEFDTGSPNRWFCVLSPANANNLLSSENFGYSAPYGMSVFANAIDSLKAIDETFDSLSNEIIMGRKRIFVSEDMCETINGEPVFDASDFSVYTLPKGFADASSLLKSENSELRVSEISNALTVDLSMFSNAVGMGKQMYDFNIANMSTAAQVYSNNSELKRRRDKHKTKIENELYDLILSLCYAADTFSHYSINPDGLTIIFDDSLFEDKATTATRKLQEIDAGVSPSYEYRMEIYGESEETAKAKVSEASQNNVQVMYE